MESFFSVFIEFFWSLMGILGFDYKDERKGPRVDFGDAGLKDEDSSATQS